MRSSAGLLCHGVMVAATEPSPLFAALRELSRAGCSGKLSAAESLLSLGVLSTARPRAYSAPTAQLAPKFRCA